MTKSPAAKGEPNLLPPGNGNKTHPEGTFLYVLISVIAEYKTKL